MYSWRPNPINIWVNGEPRCKLQANIINNIENSLSNNGAAFVTSFEKNVRIHVGIQFALGFEEEIPMNLTFGKLPKPRGTALTIIAGDDINIPDTGYYIFGRRQAVKKGAHNVIIFEGDPEGTIPEKAMWVSLAGNTVVFDNIDDSFYDQLALRIKIHTGSEYVSKVIRDESEWMLWEDWRKSNVHTAISESARALGDAGLMEDKVPIEKFASSRHIKTVYRWLNRTSFGEGMQSMLDPDLRVMAVTSSGGGKVEVSPDPYDGHVVPIIKLTRTGYVRALPDNSPIEFAPASVETHENGLVYLASALVNEGILSTWQEFLNYLKAQFAKHNEVDVLPKGMSPRILNAEHIHFEPDGHHRNSEEVEVVYPDFNIFPKVDFPCGVKDGGEILISSLFRAPSFVGKGLLKKIIIIVLPGHGMMAVSGMDREHFTNILIKQNLIRVRSF